MFEDTAQVIDPANHRYAVNLTALLGEIIIQVTNRMQADLGVALHFPHHERPADQRKQPIDSQDGAREIQQTTHIQGEHDGGENRRRHADRQADQDQFIGACISPQTAIQPK